jgi:hypothetical protein
MLIRQARAGSKTLMAMPADFFWKTSIWAITRSLKR